MTSRVGHLENRVASPSSAEEKDPAGGQAASDTDPSSLAASYRLRGVITALLCFTICCGLGFQSWVTLRVAGFDLGIFDQAVRAYSNFEPPSSAIKNFHHEFPPNFTLLGDHFTPFLALLAPLYWLWDDPRVLIIAQAALFAIGVPTIRRIANHCFNGLAGKNRRRAIDSAGLIYAFGWPLLNAAYNGFHEVAFAVPIILMMLERGLAQRYTAAAIWGLLLCGVKEDMGLIAGAFGFLIALRARRSRDTRGFRTGVTLAFAGPIVSALTIGWFLPAMGGPKGYYWSYERLGADGGDAIINILKAPWIIFEVAFTPSIKILMMLWIFGTLAFLPFGSGTTLLALPLLAERVLSDNPNHWVVINHYDAFLWPILLVASLETLGRLAKSQDRWPRLPAGIAATAAATSMAASIFLGLSPLLNPGYWKPSPDKQALAEAVELIPDGATVEADNSVAPRLTNRANVVIADDAPRGADWVLLREKDRTFPFGDPSEQKQRIELLLNHGYAKVWSKNDTTLLHRVDRMPIPGMRIPGPNSVPVREKVPSDVGRSIILR